MKVIRGSLYFTIKKTEKDREKEKERRGRARRSAKIVRSCREDGSDREGGAFLVV
jgi:hypothetical protein